MVVVQGMLWNVGRNIINEMLANRTRVPTIKKSAKKLEPSPFQLPGAPTDPPEPLPLVNSVPPCAHEQQYLLVR